MKYTTMIKYWFRTTLVTMYNLVFSGWRHVGDGHFHFFPKKKVRFIDAKPDDLWVGEDMVSGKMSQFNPNFKGYLHHMYYGNNQGENLERSVAPGVQQNDKTLLTKK